MSAETFELNGAVREQLGKAHSRRMRRLDDNIPAVIYGAGKAPLHVTLPHNQVLKALESEAFYSHILKIKVEGKKAAEKVVVKDIQRHVYKPKIMHMDFLRVSAKDKLTMKVPVHFHNEESAIGVKQEGGMVSHNLTEIEIACLPDKLPEFLEVDIAELKLGESIHLSEITLPEGVEIPSLAQGQEHDLAVVTIRAQAVEQEEDTDAAPSPEADAAGESEATEE